VPPGQSAEVVAAATVPAERTRTAREAIEVVRAALALDARARDARTGGVERGEHGLVPGKTRTEGQLETRRGDGRASERRADDRVHRRSVRVLLRALTLDARFSRRAEPSARDERGESQNASDGGISDDARELQRVAVDRRRVCRRGIRRPGLDATRDVFLSRGDAAVVVHEPRLNHRRDRAALEEPLVAVVRR